MIGIEEYFLLNEYKTYGETGFLSNYPKLLDRLAHSELALNDPTVAWRFLWTYANENRCFGELLSKLYDISLDLSEYKTHEELFKTTDKNVFNAFVNSDSLSKLLSASANTHSTNWQNDMEAVINGGNYFGYDHLYEAFSYPHGTRSIISGSGIPSSNTPLNLADKHAGAEEELIAVNSGSSGAREQTFVFSNLGLITSLRFNVYGSEYQGIRHSGINITINHRMYTITWAATYSKEATIKNVVETVHPGDTISFSVIGDLRCRMNNWLRVKTLTI